MDEILMIGGGFAGLSAGVALSLAGRRVRLIEQKPYLGGRARSFRYSPADAIVDNGQHIFMGCYHSTIQFLKTIGTLNRVRFQPRLKVNFAGKEDGQTSLVFPSLPAPLHLVLGTLCSNSFSFREKLQILHLGRALQSSESGAGVENFGRLTVDRWLAALGQSKRLRRKFWDLLCIAALNEVSHIAAASIFEPVLRLALFRSPQDSRIGLASTGLSECYTAAAAEIIRKNGGVVELERNVTSLLLSESGSANTCEGVRLSDGTAIEAQTVLSAVPSFQLVKLLPEELATTQPFFSGLAALRPAPIISINLWFDRAVTRLEFVGLRETTVQWLFNRSVLLGTSEGHVSLVISGAHDHIQKEKEELAALALADLRELFPRAREARLLHSLVIKERFATFSPSVDSADVRPPAITPVRGLYLAGDWTQTGLPATIESAVKSGYTAASAIIAGTARDAS
jgi:squalene-associated FAD-dependent desaturase